MNHNHLLVTSVLLDAVTPAPSFPKPQVLHYSPLPGPKPCVPAPPQVWPIMGAGYHAIHHTTYIDNYGHYTCTFDSLYGTLTTPEEYREALAKGISVGKLRKQIQQKKRR